MQADVEYMAGAAVNSGGCLRRSGSVSLMYDTPVIEENTASSLMIFRHSTADLRDYRCATYNSTLIESGTSSPSPMFSRMKSIVCHDLACVQVLQHTVPT